ncbi:hypothetical protein TNCV_5053391 [Trichonephila clavipes]|nr:hypothetical protein TNCV_5053391 [Trichonephila clavipes]
MPVFSTDSAESRPLRFSTELPITVLKPSIPYSDESVDLRYEKPQSRYTKHCVLYQNQKHAGTHFCFLHESSKELFTRQQRSNAICV